MSNAQPAPVRAGPGPAAPPSSPSPGLDPTLFSQACFPVTTELGHRKGLGLISPEGKARGLTKLSLNSLGQAQRPHARGTVRKRGAGSISHGRDFLGVTAPVAVYRYGIVSVPFARTHDPLGGVASFSDFQINVTYSHLF